MTLSTHDPSQPWGQHKCGIGCVHVLKYLKKKNNKKGITPSYFSIEKAEDGGHKQTLEWKKETH